MTGGAFGEIDVRVTNSCAAFTRAMTLLARHTPVQACQREPRPRMIKIRYRFPGGLRVTRYAIGVEAAAMNIGVARDARRLETQKGSFQILHTNLGFHCRRQALRVVTVAALKRRVFPLEVVSGPAVVKRASRASRPANQFEIASNVFLVAGDTICIALCSVDNPRMIATLGFQSLLNLHMA